MAWQSRAKGRGGIVVAAWLAAVLAGVACGGPPAKAPAAEALRAPPPLDLGVARRVALGFRPAGADWITGQETFQTRVAAGGAIRFVARRPAARRGPARPSETAPALALETVAIAGLGGAGETAIGPGRARADGAGGLVVERGGVRERLRNLDDGLEQAWELAARPAGTADVVIRVRVAGLAFAGETAGGLHFVDRASGLGVRYGAATFVDARARRTDLRVSYAAGELRLTVPRALLDGAAYPAVVDPYLTPELGLDNPVRGPGIDAYAAASATDGSVTLVVWVDYLDTITHIFGTRVSAAGAVLDPLGITIGTTTAIQANPAVGFGGASFLVAWEQGASSDKKVYVTRINPSNGTVMDPNGIAVSTNTFNDELQPAVSFDGTNFLVAWGVGMGSGGRIAAARLSQAGTLLDTTSLTVSTISSTYTEAQVRPALAFDGVNTLVAWEDIRNGSRDIYANRLTKAGQVLDGNGFVLATSANQKQLPKLAFDGTNTLAVWVDWIDTSTTNRDSSIVGRRVSPAGTLVDANPITISAAAGEQSDPAVAFDGTRYLVAWSDYRGADTDVYATRVGTDGTVVDPQGLPVIVAPAAQYTPELVFLAGKYFLAWVDSRGGRSSIYGARVGTDGVSVDGTGFPLPNVPNTQDTPAAASDGSRYFVVWADSRTDGPGIRGAHVTPEGQVVESTSLRVSTSPGYNSRPVVAWNGSVYLVVWSGDTRLLARRFSAAGTPLDAADIPIPSLALLSDVTSNGTDFLVVGNEVTGFDIQGVRVSGAGVLLDAAPISICAASGSQYNPRATFDGSDYFVIWPDRRDAQGHVYGARVTTAGTVLDPDGFLLSPPTGVTADYQSDPDVAFDGTNILVVWHDSRNYSIRGTRVTPAGALLDPTSAVIVSPASNLDVIGTPHVKFDGTNFVVSADHANFNSSNQIISYATTASRLTTTLATLDATSILSYPTEQLKVALASDRAGSTLFTWTLPTTLDGYPVNRVRARILSESTPAGGCTLPSQCTSGYCVDGFCCDTACGGGSMTDCLACSVGAGAAANGICGAVADGRGCNDANACTLGDTCHAGACQASSTVTCSALDACHMAGTCAVTTGLCSNPNQPNGTACPGGTCSAGSCGPASDGGNADGGDAGRDATAGGDARPDAGSSDGQPPLDAGGGGASGAGGSTGAGGSAGAGGAGGASGAAGASAGRGGGGGATAATGGNAAGGSAGGAAGGAGNISGASGSSGCGCATGPGPAAGLPVFAAGALVALVAARRRARRAPSRR